MTYLDLNNFQVGRTLRVFGGGKKHFPFGFFVLDQENLKWNRIEFVCTMYSSYTWKHIPVLIPQNIRSYKIYNKYYFIGENVIFDEDFNLLVYGIRDRRSWNKPYRKVYIRIGFFIDGRSEKKVLDYFRNASEHLEFVDDMSHFCFRVKTDFKTRSEKRTIDAKITEICNILLKR